MKSELTSATEELRQKKRLTMRLKTIALALFAANLALAGTLAYLRGHVAQ